MEQWFAIISGVILFAGAPPYLIDILRGKTKPERATWFIWSVLGIIALVSQIAEHGAWSILFVSVDALGSVLVFLLSLKYGVGGWTRLDKTALGIAAVGVVVSVVARQPIPALAGIVLADLSGVVLTVRKTFLAPRSETAVTWFFIGTASLLGAFSVGRMSLVLLIYPVYLAVANYSVLIAQGLGYAFRNGTDKTHE